MFFFFFFLILKKNLFDMTLMPFGKVKWERPTGAFSLRMGDEIEDLEGPEGYLGQEQLEEQLSLLDEDIIQVMDKLKKVCESNISGSYKQRGGLLLVYMNMNYGESKCLGVIDETEKHYTVVFKSLDFLHYFTFIQNENKCKYEYIEELVLNPLLSAIDSVNFRYFNNLSIISLIVDKNDKNSKILGKYFTMNKMYYDIHSKDIGFVDKISSYILFLQQKSRWVVGSRVRLTESIKVVLYTKEMDLKASEERFKGYMDDLLLVDESKIKNQFRREYIKMMTYIFSTKGSGNLSTTNGESKIKDNSGGKSIKGSENTITGEHKDRDDEED